MDLSGGLVTDILSIDYTSIFIVMIIAIIIVTIIAIIFSYVSLVFKSKFIAKEVIKELKEENMLVKDPNQIEKNITETK